MPELKGFDWYVASEKTGIVRVTRFMGGQVYHDYKLSNWTWDDFKTPVGGRSGESHFVNEYTRLLGKAPEFKFNTVPFFRDEEFVFPVDTRHVYVVLLALEHLLYESDSPRDYDYLLEHIVALANQANLQEDRRINHLISMIKGD